MLAPFAWRWNYPSGDDCLDLLNEPANHGWCNGYACMKRPSLFHPIAVTGIYCYIIALLAMINQIRPTIWGMPTNFRRQGWVRRPSPVVRVGPDLRHRQLT